MKIRCLNCNMATLRSMVMGVAKKSRVATMGYMMAPLQLGSTAEKTGKNFLTRGGELWMLQIKICRKI